MKNSKIWLIMLWGGALAMSNLLIGQVLIESHGTTRTLGFTREYLESLIYATDGIPGFKSVPNPYNGYHTNIYLDIGGDRTTGPMYSKIVRGWDSDDGLNWIRIECRIYDSVVSAKEAIREFVRPSSARLQHSSPSGGQIGDDCWFSPSGGKVIGCVFIVGRVFVFVNIGAKRRITSEELYGSIKPAPLDASIDIIAESLAYGLEYAILQRPELLAKAGDTGRHQLLVKGKPVQIDPPVLTFQNITLAPLSVFKVSGAKVKGAKNNIVAITHYGHTWVKVKAFSWEMETEKGKVKLERPVFPYKGDLIVPLRQVAEALGITVKQKGQTIALLTK